MVSCAWFVLTARHVRCLLYCFPALLVLCSLAHLVPHLVLIISLASLYSSLCFSVFCHCCVFFHLHWLYYSPLVLSGFSARSCFCVSLHPLCASRYRGLPSTPAVPGYLRTHCGLLSLPLGLASSLAGFIASAAVTARPAVAIDSSAWQRILLHSNCLWKHSSPVLFICCPIKPLLPWQQYKFWVFLVLWNHKNGEHCWLGNGPEDDHWHPPQRG